MPQRETDKPVEDDAPGVPGWVVTFSDCMTLLLCFFVMLLTFSSFDEATRSRFAGLFASKPAESISHERQSPTDALVPPRPRQMDHTKQGSEQPTKRPPKRVKNPHKLPNILETDAYRDKKVLRIVTDRLFWGNGARLSGGGRQRLNMIAAFLRRLPCHVIIGEALGADESIPGRAHPLGRGLSRSWVIVEYLTRREGLSPERFHVAAAGRVAPARFGGKPVTEFVLLSRSAYK